MRLLQEAIEQMFDAGLSYPDVVRSVQRRYLRLLLEKHLRKQSRVAAELGMSPKMLRRHMEDLGIQRRRTSSCDGVTTKPSEWVTQRFQARAKAVA